MYSLVNSQDNHIDVYYNNIVNLLLKQCIDLINIVIAEGKFLSQ